MSIDTFEQYQENDLESDPTRTPGQGVLDGIHHQADALDQAAAFRLEHNAMQRAELFAALIQQRAQEGKSDPRNLGWHDVYGFAHELQDFVLDTTLAHQRFLQARQMLDPDYIAPEITVYDPVVIERCITYYFQTRFVDPRFLSEAEQKAEAAFLAHGKSRTEVTEFGDAPALRTTPFIDEPTPYKHATWRAATHPQIRYMAELQTALTDAGAVVAARAAEVNLWAFGSWPVAAIELSGVTLKPSSSRPERVIGQSGQLEVAPVITAGRPQRPFPRPRPAPPSGPAPQPGTVPGQGRPHD